MENLFLTKQELHDLYEKPRSLKYLQLAELINEKILSVARTQLDVSFEMVVTKHEIKLLDAIFEDLASLGYRVPDIRKYRSINTDTIKIHVYIAWR